MLYIEQLSKDYIEPLDQIAFDVNYFIQKLLDLGIVIDKNESAVRDDKPNN